MNRLSRHVELALDFARAHKFDESLPAYVTAMIVSGGRVLSVGYNSRANSGLQQRYKTNPFCNSIHAEVDAILNVRRKIDLTGSKIIVVRRLKNDTRNKPLLAMARPCMMCSAVLYSYGIRKAIYTIENNKVGTLKITDPRTTVQFDNYHDSEYSEL